jgi:DNA-binding NarL/FixJ family response regulator
LADDDPVVRSMLGMALERQFEIVAAVGDSERAVARAAEVKPDVALVDVQMPGGGGAHAVRGIAATSPSTAIVVLSSDELECDVHELLELGATAYLRKGVGRERLIETLHAAIRTHRLHAEAS